MLERRWARWILIFGVWTLLGALSAVRVMVTYAYSGNFVTWRRALVIALADWYVWALLAPAIAWLARRFAIERRSWLRGLLVHLPASLFFSIIKMMIEFRLLQWLDPPSAQRYPVLQFPSTLFTYYSILGAIYAFDYYGKYRAHEWKASQLQAQLAQAQLQALKMQLHPHFLFNTLHAISSLMRRDVEAAERMITRLSDLLRMTLENVGAQETPLRQELEFLERYLEIEQTRFRDRLQVKMEIEPETLDARVPNLILQPLVENAVRHGIAPRAAPGLIEISARRDENKLELQIRDNGAGLPDAKRARVKEGVGLANTRARLEQLYVADYRFDLSNHDKGGLVVSLTIPFRVEEKSATE
ncbi:MAG TPA: histidine kinase [Blastocatellia bacterium]|jgi:signal transduction histidine kinase|nr:histidine kinase [Blastocatellia bacterium]